MSLVFGRISKRILCFGRDACVRRSIRLFSSSSSPYLLLPGDVTGSGKAVNFSVYDPRKGQIVKIPDQTLPPELHSAQRVGASRGWVALLNKRYLTLHLTNIFNPSASPSSHKVITLPSLGCLPCFFGFTRNPDGSLKKVMRWGRLDIESPECTAPYMVDHVSLSSSPDEDGCVVGVWLWGQFLGFCRPGDKGWTCNRNPLKWRASKVMYSKRDKVFYNTSETLKYVQVYDLNNPKFLPRRDSYECASFHNIPEMVDSETETPRKRYQEEYIVETPTGELLVAIRDLRSSCKDEGVKTVQFRVYRLDIKKETRTWTEDIGDLSVFLGRNEGFCVPASQYPGLKPNSIYFADDQYLNDAYSGLDMGVYDLAGKTVTGFCNSDPRKGVPGSFWLAPLA